MNMILEQAALMLRDYAAPCEQVWELETRTLGHGIAWVNLPAAPHAWGMHGFEDEARYVTLMQPTVAMALADVLHYEALRDEPNTLMVSLAQEILDSSMVTKQSGPPSIGPTVRY